MALIRVTVRGRLLRACPEPVDWGGKAGMQYGCHGGGGESELHCVEVWKGCGKVVAWIVGNEE